MAERGRTQDAISRARKIAGRIAKGEDLRIRAEIEGFGGELDYTDRTSLCVADDAWRYVTGAGIEPRMVFAHPELLKTIPNTSLHYRGIALLSRKRVQEIAGSIDTWERQPATARVSDSKALKVCRLYNAVISSLIVDHTEWTVDDGYRNILATMGITEDGAIRNIIGQEAELAIKKRLVDWVRSQGLLVSSDESRTVAKAAPALGAGGLRMKRRYRSPAAAGGRERSPAASAAAEPPSSVGRPVSRRCASGRRDRSGR